MSIYLISNHGHSTISLKRLPVVEQEQLRRAHRATDEAGHALKSQQ
jgi:hypothetical protein